MKNLLVFVLILLTACHKGKSSNEEPTLIGGREANPKDYPASVYARIGNSACSATVVGPQSLLIAAHCAPQGSTANFSLGANAYSSICSRSPLYQRGVDHDLALCKIDKVVPGIPYENVNLNPDMIEIGKEILLTGYGCIRRGGGGGNDGIYRIGEATITALPSPYDLTAKGKAALCFGDSGGPAFLYLDAEKTKRVQVSVNSKGDIRQFSYLTVTSSKASVDFLTSWADANSVKICGVHTDTSGCRDSVPPAPPPSPQPSPEPSCLDAYKKIGLCLKDASSF